MKRFTIALSILCFSFLALLASPGANADEWNKKTTVTFSQPVEIPGGIILPAGTYVFLLMDSMSDRHIVRIFSEGQKKVLATILAIPNYRLQTTDKTVMTFGERSVGSPEAIRAWFYPGANWGEEFVYPKKRAVELAKTTNQPVLAMPVEMEPAITTPVTAVNEPPVETLKSAPIKAVKPTGDEVAVTDVVEPPPTATGRRTPPPAYPSETATTALPQTDGQIPLLALIGVMALGCGLLLISRRSG